MSKLAKAAVFAGLVAIFLALIHLGAFGYLRGTLADRLYSGAPPLRDIIIVRIDDESIAAIGRWPWSRDVQAGLLRKLTGARAIGMDVSFLEATGADGLLSDTLASMPQVVLAAEVVDGQLNVPVFPSAHGVVNLVADPDGTMRRFDPALPGQPFAFAMATAIGITPPALAERTLINFVGPPNSYPSLSASDVMAGDHSFAGKIVLVGATAPDLHDAYFVPTSDGIAMPGVEIHATILQNAVLRSFLTAEPALAVAGVAVLLGAFGMFALASVRIRHSIPIVAVLVGAYLLGAATLFERQQLVLDVFFAPLALLTFTGAGIGIGYVEEKRQGLYVRQAFSKYVSRELLGELLAKKPQLALGGEKRTVTVFFSDIRDFTSISESLPPEQLVQLLNEYLTEMTAVVLKHHGTVDKFIGDSIMAIWNAPMTDAEHAFRACSAALEQAGRIQALQARWAERGVPLLQVGIGINTGPAVVGNMGSEDRFDYTAIGDAVNVASRIEQLTKTYGANVIISEHTRTLVGDRLLCCKLDVVRIKGKRDPLVVYRLCEPSEGAYVRVFEAGLAHYLAGEFARALKAFTAAATIQADTPCAIFIERCRHRLALESRDSKDSKDSRDSREPARRDLVGSPSR